jgi:uncharacterized coiled-coil protein SlyX
MNETFSLIRDITEIIGLFFIPLMAWVMWTIVSHGKQIIVLEQKVNDSLNQRMMGIEKRVGGIEDKIEEMSDNVTECKIIAHDNKHLHGQISLKFDTLIAKLDNMGN